MSSITALQASATRVERSTQLPASDTPDSDMSALAQIEISRDVGTAKPLSSQDMQGLLPAAHSSAAFATTSLNLREKSDCDLRDLPHRGLLSLILDDLVTYYSPENTLRCLNTFLRNNAGLQQLSMKKVWVDDSVLKTLGASNAKLADLYLRGIRGKNGFTGEGMEALLRGCPLLRRLSMPWCNSVDGGVIRAIARFGQKLEKLYLDFSQNFDSYEAVSSEALVNMIKSCRGLQELSLSYCARPWNYGDDVMRALGENCRDLRMLSCCGSAATDAGVEALAKGCRGLHTLCLANGQGELSNKAMEALGTYSRSLQRLAIRKNSGITIDGLDAVLKGCPLLRRIRCSVTPAEGATITPEQIAALKERYRARELSINDGEWDKMVGVDADNPFYHSFETE